MKKLLLLVVIILAFATGRIVEAQTIGIEPVVTRSIIGTAPVTGLAGLRIQAIAPAALTITCIPQGRAVETCSRPSVAQYDFDDFSDLIQSSDPIEPFGTFQFAGPSGNYDIVFSVLNADDDSGDRIFYDEIITQITIP